jgi:hypothetical protein
MSSIADSNMNDRSRMSVNNNNQFLDLEIGKTQHIQQEPLVKCGGKRKFEQAFTDKVYDDTRYGQHIGEDFFKTNYGSNCNTLETLEEGDAFNPANIKEITDSNGKKIDVDELLSWCAYYLANRKLFQI